MSVNITERANITCCVNKEYSEDDVLWEYNENLFRSIYLPSFVYLIVLATLGLFGNSFILYVYGCKFKRTNAHFFILSLAVLDALSCVTMVIETLDKRFPVYSGDYRVLCKITRLAEMFSIVASSTLLLCIAIDRYYKVCRPFKRFSHRKARMCLIGSVCIGLVLSWPMALFHGPETVHTGLNNVSGLECGDDDQFKHSNLPVIYFVVMGVLNIIVIILLSYFYIRIFRAVMKWKRSHIGEKIPTSPISVIPMNSRGGSNIFSWRKFSRQKRYDWKPTNKLSDYDVNDNENKFGRFQTSQKNNSENSSICDKNSNQGCENMSFKVDECDRNKKHPPTCNGETKPEHKFNKEISVSKKHKSHVELVFRKDSTFKTRRKSIKDSKTVTSNTILFSVVTIIYILSFLPTTFVETLNAANVYNDESLSNRTRSVLIILNLTYFFNNIANQYVYSAIDPAFRREVKQLFLRPCK